MENKQNYKQSGLCTNSTRTKKCWIQTFNSIGRHDDLVRTIEKDQIWGEVTEKNMRNHHYLDITSIIETIELGQQL